MEYSAQVRKDIKRECKARVLQRFGSCVGIYLLYMLPFIVVGALFTFAIMMGALNLFVKMAMVFASMFGLVDAWGVAGFPMSGFLEMAVLLILPLLIIIGPLTFGLAKFYIGMRRGEQPTLGTLFAPFTSARTFLNGLKMFFCVGFRTLLWMIIPIIISVFCLPLIWQQSISNDIIGYGMDYLVLPKVITLVLVFFAAVKIMTYQAGWIVIYDNEKYGAWAATRDASAVFRGHYGKLTGFFLSFIPWGILTTLITRGALSLIAQTFGLQMQLFIGKVFLCITSVIGAFVAAYILTSFVGLYEFFVTQQHEQYQSYATGQAQQNAVPQRVHYNAPASTVAPTASPAPTPEQTTAPPEQQQADGDSAPPEQQQADGDFASPPSAEQ